MFCQFPSYTKLIELLCQDTNNESVRSANLPPEICQTLREEYRDVFGRFCPTLQVGRHRDPVLFDLAEDWIPVRLQNKTKNPFFTDEYGPCLDDAFNRGPIIVCKGDGGRGKTTLTKKICYDWATDRLPQYHLVLYCRLRQCKSAPVLKMTLEWMTRKKLLSPRHASTILAAEEHMTFRPIDAQRTGSSKLHTLVILDGLDEIVLDNFIHLKEILQDQEQSLHYAMLLTSRIVPNNSVMRPAEILHFLTFKKDQVSALIQTHFKGNDEGMERVQTLLDNDPNIKQLSKTPLFLSYICLMAKQTDFESCTRYGFLKNMCSFLIRRYGQKKSLPIHELIGSEDWLLCDQVDCLSTLAWHAEMNDEEQRGFSRHDFSNFQCGTDIAELFADIGFLIKDEIFDSEEALEPMSFYWFAHQLLQTFFAVRYLYRKTLIPIAQMACQSLEQELEASFNAAAVAEVIWRVWQSKREQKEWVWPDAIKHCSVVSDLMVLLYLDDEGRTSTLEKLVFSVLHKAQQYIHKAQTPVHRFFFSRITYMCMDRWRHWRPQYELNSKPKTELDQFIRNAVQAGRPIVRLHPQLFYVPDLHIALFISCQSHPELDQLLIFRCSEQLKVTDVDLYIASDAINELSVEISGSLRNIASIRDLTFIISNERRHNSVVDNGARADQLSLQQLIRNLNKLEIPFEHFRMSCGLVLSQVIKDLPSALGSNQKLRSISLEGRQFLKSTRQVQRLISVIGSCRSLGILELNNVGIKPDALIDLVRSFKLATNLNAYSLERVSCMQEMDSLQFVRFCRAVQDTHIGWLSLEDNQLTDTHIGCRCMSLDETNDCCLLDLIRGMPRLLYISMARNSLSLAITQEIPYSAV